MHYSVRFFISWILAAVLMYVAFYVWHGLFLNDLSRISFSKAVFMALAALVYLVISFVIYRAFNSRLAKKIYNQFLRGVLVGAALGFILFSVITVLGISFTKNVTFTYMVADCGWQVVEQCIGGIIVALGHILIFEPNPEFGGAHSD
ncbi:MAG: hypothetical protein JST26_14355 [Bacteroidetes bacterium]|nr:hypothetical protein [Bacteroidota bacterium]